MTEFTFPHFFYTLNNYINNDSEKAGRMEENDKKSVATQKKLYYL